MATRSTGWALSDLSSAGNERHLIAVRLVAGLPLLLIGLAHVFDDAAPMRPLVEAAGLPAASVLSPAAVGIEIVAGVLLLLGLYARLGALLAIPTMAVAAYAHLAIDTWPNSAGEPPILLPVLVFASAAYVLLRGAGAWSIDNGLGRDNQ
jgi:putative oxidoreductase